MSITHRDPWTAKVHAYMLASKTQATGRQIEAMFGRPSECETAAYRLWFAMESGWFAVAQQAKNGRRELSYIALPKESLRRGARPAKPAKVRPAPAPAPEPTRFASVWDFGQARHAPVPARTVWDGSTSIVRVHIISDAEREVSV